MEKRLGAVWGNITHLFKRLMESTWYIFTNSNPDLFIHSNVICLSTRFFDYLTASCVMRGKGMITNLIVCHSTSRYTCMINAVSTVYVKCVASSWVGLFITAVKTRPILYAICKTHNRRFMDALDVYEPLKRAII